MTLYLSMGLFALVASISPGPVNITTLTTSVNIGSLKTMPFVTGATVGFSLLLLCIGLLLQHILQFLPMLTIWTSLAGIAFLLYLAYQLFVASGRVDLQSLKNQQHQNHQHRLSALSGVRGVFAGAMMQWLNPKAWIASFSGMAAFTNNQLNLVLWFTLIYFLVCYCSISCWALLGDLVRPYLHQEKYLQWFNRAMSLLLVLCALSLLYWLLNKK